MGYVYLIHFDEPYRHARHYCGYTSKSMKQRMLTHKAGGGARLMAAVTRAGIGWSLVRYWRGNQRDELRFKQRNPKAVHRSGAAHGLERYCPLCHPGKTWKDGRVRIRRIA